MTNTIIKLQQQKDTHLTIHAINIGNTCIKAKSSLLHGQYGPWVKEFGTQIGRSRARLLAWMILAKYAAKFPDVRNLPISEACAEAIAYNSLHRM